MRIGIVLDNPKRDLRGTALTAYQILKLGHKPFVIPLHSASEDAKSLNLDVILVNCLRLSNQKWLQGLRKRGIHVCVLDTEAGHLGESGIRSPKGWAEFIKKNNLHKSCDSYLFWGQRMHEGFLKYSGFMPQQLATTGCPRYDFCSAPWESLIPKERKNLVLINTNFPGAFPKFSRSMKKETQNAKEAGVAENQVIRIFKAQARIRKDLIEVMHKLLVAYPEIQFVLRPHPFEDCDHYQRAFSTYSNFSINLVGEAIDLICQAKAIAHVNCSTAIEALLTNTPCIQMEFLNDKEWHDYAPIPGKVSHLANSYEEFSKWVERPPIWTDVERTQLIDKYIKPDFGFLDGNNSLRVATALCSIKQKSKPVSDPNEQVALSLKQTIKYFLVKALGTKRFSEIKNIIKPRGKEKVIQTYTLLKLLKQATAAEDNTRLKNIKVTYFKPENGLHAASFEITAKLSPKVTAKIKKSKPLTTW